MAFEYGSEHADKHPKGRVLHIELCAQDYDTGRSKTESISNILQSFVNACPRNLKPSMVTRFLRINKWL